MKKILLITIPSVIVLLISVLFICLYSIPRLEYEYDTKYDGYVVYKAFGNAKSYTVPESYKDKKVVGVNTRAFFRHSKLEEIEFENKENIKYIGRLAFSECENLKSIDLEYVVEIERNAFSYDESLTSITTGAKYIGASSFYGCSNLNNVTLNEGVLSIGQNAFSQCKSLNEIRIPNSVANLYDDVFSNSSITKVYASIKLSENQYLKSLDYVVYEE